MDEYRYEYWCFLGVDAVRALVDANGAAGGFWVVMAFAWIMVVLMIVGLPSLRRHTVSAERASHLPAIENDGEHSGEDH